MASITIRNIEDDVKQAIRVRAAGNGRSVEEELRTVLRDLASRDDNSDAGASAEIDTSLPVFGRSGAMEGGTALTGKTVLLIISGGIAAYKSLDLIRRLRERDAAVRVILTEAAQQFVTPMAAAALSGGHCYTDLWDRQSEIDVGHIRLARSADLVIVAPATADRMAKMVQGIGDDLAGAVLLAIRAPILIAPAMNPAMWSHPATQRNVATLKEDGHSFIGPDIGEMAETGEAGLGRMAEPLAIAEEAAHMFSPLVTDKPLAGKHIVVTSGPTHEPIDPVRYIANRSSGRQGHAIAGACARAGAKVTLVSGPVTLADPQGVEVVRVQTALEMKAAVEEALPADVAIFVAAVADYRASRIAEQKTKKTEGGLTKLKLTENPDILASIAHHENMRPALIVGFAAETTNVEVYAEDKRIRKGADLIVANDVSHESGIGGPGGVMGGTRNRVALATANGVESWPEMGKDEVAERLVLTIADLLPD
ncbi:bifunctional phosphopantothenoylcysteine decarboxylase/phosphopantothenate--cysteine ligase CoaBC [Notoacmeibacter sp. MSK16QG-6]|uniref:bifunctional phosphopantothenoylcysteine decarboxylase/phosphopantothenate--cysteine ligase CoaBC n=1 Tax=Notoacmeibacter sp. MSK16QG-6 TaxID=2957982 RepID=UPI00209E03D3|nr:bifunctional phosphopantothenoylcysteine decarboxylase/phosphopantothenate--cysteine ligase CoaBC [Notoacmeibacter sp. MSK16QG-6]MCP1198955.1 bifunctional phosphopantothenoylcysteine decarboxylase/phosphopantothenate--cysteine ligase CoaBC [Notoacmeibacter sp. MSK16QG-6]